MALEEEVDGAVPFAPEFVEGVHVPPVEEEVATGEAEDLCVEVAKAVEQSHEHGVVHNRDRNAEADRQLEQLEEAVGVRGHDLVGAEEQGVGDFEEEEHGQQHPDAEAGRVLEHAPQAHAL